MSDWELLAIASPVLAVIFLGNAISIILNDIKSNADQRTQSVESVELTQREGADDEAD